MTSRLFLEKYMTIAMINVHETSLSIFFDSNVDDSSSEENSSTTILTHDFSTQYVFSTNWASKIYVKSNLNSLNNKIEDNFTNSSNIDVNYVDDYSVSITYSFKNSAITDCNVNLFN